MRKTIRPETILIRDDILGQLAFDASRGISAAEWVRAETRRAA